MKNYQIVLILIVLAALVFDFLHFLKKKEEETKVEYLDNNDKLNEWKSYKYESPRLSIQSLNRSQPIYKYSLTDSYGKKMTREEKGGKWYYYYTFDDLMFYQRKEYTLAFTNHFGKSYTGTFDLSTDQTISLEKLHQKSFAGYYKYIELTPLPSELSPDTIYYTYSTPYHHEDFLTMKVYRVYPNIMVETIVSSDIESDQTYVNKFIMDRIFLTKLRELELEFKKYQKQTSKTSNTYFIVVRNNYVNLYKTRENIDIMTKVFNELQNNHIEMRSEYLYH